MAVIFSKKRGVPGVLQGRYQDDPGSSGSGTPSPSNVVVDPTGQVVSPGPVDDGVYDPTVDDDPSAPIINVDPSMTSSLVVSGSAIARKTASSTLLIPFFGYLALSDKLPGWARVFAGVAGAGILLQRMDGSMAGYRGCGCGCNGAPGGCQG